MLQNYLLIVLRTIQHQKAFSLINISGLAIGLASCLLILLYIQDELAYDRFHQNADRIYRVVEERRLTNIPRKFAISYSPISDLIHRDFPEITPVRFYPTEAEIYVDSTTKFVEKQLFYTDSTLFDVFNFNLLKGNPNTALQKPFTAVLTENIAKKYFGNQDPIGQRFFLNGTIPFTITGVMENSPSNSHIKFNILTSFVTIEAMHGNLLSSDEAWWVPELYTYLLFPENYPIDDFKKIFPEFLNRNESKLQDDKRIFTLQPLTDIHLRSHLENELESNSDIRYVYIFAAIAVFILIIASLNFMNLSTAKSVKRAREVGLRKVAGAHRNQLIIQFLSESVFLVFIAFVIAIAIIELLLPIFNVLIEKQLSLSNFLNPYILVGFLVFILVTGVFSGSYPALYLSRFKVVNVLKQRFTKSSSKIGARRVLVIIQFTISIVLIACTIMINKQLDFLHNAALGFNEENILIVPVHETPIVEKHESFTKKLLKHQGIKNTTFSASLPGIRIQTEYPYKIESTPSKGTLPNILTFAVDYNFFDTYQMEFIEGRKFDESIPNDMDSAFILNQSAVESFGWEHGVGKDFTLLHFTDSGMTVKQGKIVGVVNNFHYNSLHHTIEPVVIELAPSLLYYKYLSVKLDAKKQKQATAYIKNKWEQLLPKRPFDAFYLRNRLDKQYKQEEKVNKVIYYFSLFAIVVACLGLFGLAAYTAEQRVKEISVRKVLGASVLSVILLLSKDFIKWVFIAHAIAIPVSYYIIHKWLQNFAYRVEIDFFMLLLAGLIALFIALLTVIFQMIKVATRSPVVALRYE